MASLPYNLADLNMALMESPFWDLEKLRPFMNPRGRKPAAGLRDAKPLVTTVFIASFLPTEFTNQDPWKFAYIEHKGSSALLKFMTGSPDGLSTHRKVMTELARKGFTVSADSDRLLFPALGDQAQAFFSRFAAEKPDPKATFSCWETETAPLLKRTRLAAPMAELLGTIRAILDEPDRSMEAYAGMLLAGLLCGIPAHDEGLCAEWAAAFRIWHDQGYPRSVHGGYSIEAETARLTRYYEPLCRSFAEKVRTDILPGLSPDPAAFPPAEQITVFTGPTGSGRKAHLQRLFMRASEEKGNLIPLYITNLTRGSLLESVAKLLHCPGTLRSWEMLEPLIGSRTLFICLPDLTNRNSPDTLIGEITRALEEMTRGVIQFAITSLVCPYEFTRFTHAVFQCQPLSDSDREAYLEKILSPEELCAVRSDPVLWKLLELPMNLTHYTAVDGEVCDDVPLSPEQPKTAGALLYNYMVGLTVPGSAETGQNASILYLLPALGACMTYLGVSSISHRRAHGFLNDPAVSAAIHLEPLLRLRYAFSEQELPARFQALVRLGLLVSRNGTYSFATPQLCACANAMHSLNLFDIEVKENVFIPSSYPYDSHNDYFWQLFSAGRLAHYERLLPVLGDTKRRWDYARFMVTRAIVSFYGNGSDEPGCVNPALSGEAKKQHFLDTLERCASLLKPLAWEETPHYPCAAWNFIYFRKRLAEEYLAEGKEREKAEGYLREAFALNDREIRYYDEHPDAPDAGFARKHLYDKYAQFLLQRCYPIEEQADGTFSLPGKDAPVTPEALEAEILRCLDLAAGESNDISINRLALLSLRKDPPEYRQAFVRFLRSASLGDVFAVGMAAELLLDHSSLLADVPLPPGFAPADAAVRPLNAGEAAAQGLTEDCCIAFIRTHFHADAYRSIVSDSRKSRYATSFHQLGRAYLRKGQAEEALPYLEAAFAMDWSQNDNAGEFERLRADLDAARAAAGK